MSDRCPVCKFELHCAGCLEKKDRIDELEAEVERLRELAGMWARRQAADEARIDRALSLWPESAVIPHPLRGVLDAIRAALTGGEE